MESVPTTLSNREETEAYLKHLGVSYKAYDHEEARTMVELAERVKLEHAPLIKNLFYKCKKKFYLVLAHNDTKVERGFWAL